jgi:hypothetical protein
MSEEYFHSESRKMRELPTVLRSEGAVHILLEASAAQSLFEAVKSAGLVAAPPVLVNYDDLVEEFQIKSRKGESCIIVSDPDHRIAEILAQWRGTRP